MIDLKLMAQRLVHRQMRVKKGEVETIPANQWG